jgi:hypothetical protein
MNYALRCVCVANVRSIGLKEGDFAGGSKILKKIIGGIVINITTYISMCVSNA